MVYAEISGGLGNQLYKYATAYAVSKEFGHKLILDTTILDCIVDKRCYELDGLQVVFDGRINWGYRKSILNRAFLNKIKRAKATNFSRIITEDYGPGKYSPSLFESASRYKNLYLNAGWQRYEYFEKYCTEISEMCIPSFDLSQETRTIEKEIKNCNSVAVHIRRGDYVDLNLTLSSEYYVRALKFIEDALNKPEYFIFSDDLDYCHHMSLFKDNNRCHYIQTHEKRSTIIDFYLMRMCKHQIMANSSYSWWAAYTNTNKNKVVLAPEGGDIRKGLYPKEWIIV